MIILVEATKKVSTTSKRKQHLKQYLPIYLLALPGIILMIVYRYIPMAGVSLAFTNYTAGMPMERIQFEGFKWFEHIFTDADFIQAFFNTLYISALKLIFGFPAPIVLALLLNEIASNKIRRIAQTVLYLPHFLSWSILAGIIFTLLSAQTGIMGFFGIEESLLLNSDAFVPLLVVSDIWKGSGWGTIVYLAAISSIDPGLYEAAMIDGANRFQRVWYITLPSIKNTIVILLILRCGGILNAGFDQVFMLMNDAVIDVADILDTLVYRLGLSQGNFALSTAAGLFKSLVGLILVLTVNKIAKKVDPSAGII